MIKILKPITVKRNLAVLKKAGGLKVEYLYDKNTIFPLNAKCDKNVKAKAE